jgi:hypothetical protein
MGKFLFGYILPLLRADLSLSLFGGPDGCTRPRLYLYLVLSIERRHMDNPPRNSCLPVDCFVLFYVRIIVGNNPATSSDGTRGSVVLAGGQGREA